ncbi:hypothetical protein MRB53_014304 [Persea americana]|uniref:Uncharacterized protein n=1 Tax=Persea americana TaxID=3435 RepID=A0ACC2KB26_PERAE|nr:hypothetical protein MRB53_014304 [Persea americana]
MPFCRRTRNLVRAFSAADNYLIACGSPQSILFQGQTFVPDSPESSFMLRSVGDSAFSSSSSTAPSPIYQALRIFTKPSSYEFSIHQQGRHWVRLYFHPLPNSGHDLNSAFITVITEKFVLLNNFTFKNEKDSFLFKEFLINVMADTLNINFVPSNNSVAFVNGIEVVSVPDGLISDQASAVSPSPPFNGLSERALETVFRLNMGGPLLTPENDTLGRTWENDQKYLHVNSSAVNVSVNPGNVKYPVGVTTETAPNWVYSTAQVMGDPNVPDSNFNITWVFSVDPDFNYFVRLHFCDIISKALNELVFNVYINSDIALASLDLSKLGNLEVASYRDFVSNSSNGSTTMSVSIGPDAVADITNAILNGLEIMKISNDAGSLDGESSAAGILPATLSKKNKMGIIIGVVAGALAAVGLIAIFYCCYATRRSKASAHAPWLPLPLYGNSHTMTKASTTSQKSGTASFISLASSNLGRVFTFQEIMDSTNKFDESLLLGVGGFGKVYRGMLEDGTRVAVKRGNPRSEQGLAEFHTEIEMLSKLRHRHLVNIAEWAMSWQKKGMLEHVMDQVLVGKINLASLRKFGETAEKCLAEQGVDRPAMGDVLWNLEYVLQLEETSTLSDIDENSTNHIADIPLTPLQPFDNSVSMIDPVNPGTDDDAEDAATSAVFSQLVNPRGR